jgi:Dyp-type peroxidase family
MAAAALGAAGGASTATVGSAWRLAPEHAAHTQALVVTGFRGLPEGRALFLRVDRPAGRWMRRLLEVAPATPAAEDAKDLARASALALTASGLTEIGLPEDALASFARPFREGMFQADRARRLGDRYLGQWLPTCIEGGPKWSGNPEPPRPPAAPRAYDVEKNDDNEETATPCTVHALLLLYARTDDEADAWAREVTAALGPHGVEVVHRLELEYNVEERDKVSNVSREHFGFADGLSQPTPFDPDGAVLTRDGRAVTECGRVHGVPLGDLLLGFPNAYGQVPPGPATSADDAGAAVLPEHRTAPGFADLGFHGTYLAVRELRQDVRAFWESMEQGACALRKADPGDGTAFTAEWLAERVVGRSKDGHLLCPGRLRPPTPDQVPDNDFLFLRGEDADRHGRGCPLGSHVRRANPRDGLAPTDSEAETLLAAANNHRILRRGRKYGPRYDKERPDDKDRGLLFIGMNTDIARQFEFIQQTWLVNRDFATLRNEQDPLLGPAGRMTIPAEPFRHALHIETFVRLAGGEYFFLPSLPALEYLAGLGA